MSVAAAVSDLAIAVRERLRGKVGQTKVKRYWPGRAPEWAENIGAQGQGDYEEEDEMDKRKARLVADDPRLRRLREVKPDHEDAIARHREIRAAEIVSTTEEDRARQEREDEEMDEEEDDEAIERRRQRIKEALLKRQMEEELPAEEEEEEEEDEEEEESEYETDSEEEGGIAIIKPVFVPKAERETMLEKEKLEAEEMAIQEAIKQKKEIRKLETRQLVIEEIKKDEEIEKSREAEAEADIADVNTDDEINEAEEYELWKNREINRIRRDREDREQAAKEKDELEKLRSMTEEERREWERKNPKQVNVNTKAKWKFLQKYYHKGAFYQVEADDKAGTAGGDEIYGRDFSAPTGEDALDKSILPKVMQVKHFGRSGRTKWTHLVNEDTTQWDNPWAFNDPLRAKYNSKMAGMNQPIAKPKGSKKLKDWDQI